MSLSTLATGLFERNRRLKYNVYETERLIREATDGRRN